MIRVLHSVSYMSRGGIETMLMNYYRNLDRSKVQFDFLCNSQLSGAYDEEILKLGGRIFRSPGFSPFKRKSYKKYMQNLFKEHPEYRIVEAHNDGVGAFALEAAKKSKVPIRIYHAHNTAFPLDYKWPIKMYCKAHLKEWATHNFACGVDAAKYFYGNENISKGNYRIIQNAIDIDLFEFNSEVRKKLRNEYKIQDRIVIGHVGRFAKQKNHSRIIDIFHECLKIDSRYVLVLIGKGELYNEIRDKIQKLNLQDFVIYVGESDIVNNWYSAFDLFLMPSLYEGLPVVGVEAQASDLPCLFSSNITQEISLSPLCNYFSLSESNQNWAERINQLIKNNEVRCSQRKLISSAGYDIYKEAFKLQSLYTELNG